MRSQERCRFVGEVKMAVEQITRNLGVNYLGDGRCEFVIWSPFLSEVSLRIVSGTRKSIIPLNKDGQGYWSENLADILPGTRYFYRIKEDSDLPDPVSHHQPEDILGPSCIVDHSAFKWSDQDWKGVPLEKMVIYELHVGTFTSHGTFEDIIDKLDYLCELGITAIELMPVAQFSGERNWGYDGVFPFAVQHSYGGPQGLKELVNNCHRSGISVILDVVYNHLGPEGNFIPEFMPFFTGKHRAPWGEAVNFDDTYSWWIRSFLIQNALFWLENYHIDALRLDAVHSIFDMSAKHFLSELSENVEQFSRIKGKKFYLLAESDLNDVKIISSKERGGYGIDAQWNDDFHHALHVLLTKETKSYYKDFGEISHLVKALKDGFVYSWEYSQFRKRYHGSSSSGIPARQLIIFSQNHDQVGNRAYGERLSVLVSFEALKLAACIVILSPYIPLIFMGEEYAEKAPFQYFMSFHNKKLIKAVYEGRKKEFVSYITKEGLPDPHDLQTFLRSKLRWKNKDKGKHCALFQLYKKLIQLRKTIPAIYYLDKNSMETEAYEDKKLIILRRAHLESKIIVVMNFNDQPAGFKLEIPDGKWIKILDSADKVWEGPGSSLPEEISSCRELIVAPFTCIVWEEARS